MKKTFNAWAVKLRGRSFALDHNGHPIIMNKESSAKQFAWDWNDERKVKAQHVKVLVIIEEVE